ncbi:MAG: hypothetical protein GX639_20435 [Fibrobacter sp.]|nr:hypothetical protein [Fibrobacter sp.]
MDTLTPARRSWNMSRIKGKDTKPKLSCCFYQPVIMQSQVLQHHSKDTVELVLQGAR